MGVFTRRIIKENLDQVDIFLQDNNNEIFVVQDIPDTFVQGRTAFKIFGSNLLLDNVPLKIEILDKAGETVYVQPIKYGLTNPKLPYRHISVEVYREINVPGEAKLVILGELDPSVVNVPQQFQGRYNVKYSKVINIDTFSFKNTHLSFIFPNFRTTISSTSFSNGNVAGSFEKNEYNLDSVHISGCMLKSFESLWVLLGNSICVDVSVCTFFAFAAFLFGVFLTPALF